MNFKLNKVQRDISSDQCSACCYSYNNGISMVFRGCLLFTFRIILLLRLPGNLFPTSLLLSFLCAVVTVVCSSGARGVIGGHLSPSCLQDRFSNSSQLAKKSWGWGGGRNFSSLLFRAIALYHVFVASFIVPRCTEKVRYARNRMLCSQLKLRKVIKRTFPCSKMDIGPKAMVRKERSLLKPPLCLRWLLPPLVVCMLVSKVWHGMLRSY